MKRKDGKLAMALAILAVGLAAMLLQGCNTVEGIGSDFSAAGQGLADAAHDANPDNK